MSIKNIDKIKDEETRKWLIYWNEHMSTVTINDDGIYMLDLITPPPFRDAHMHIKTDEDE